MFFSNSNFSSSATKTFLRPRTLGVFALAIIGIMAFQSYVNAQESTPENATDTDTQTTEQSGEAIRGTLLDQDKEGKRTPVKGVSISVFLGDTKIGEGKSDSEGNWRVSVPSAGTYRMRLDTSTLPTGVTLTDPKQQELPEVEVRENQQKRVIFRLGEVQGSGISRLERFSNLFLAGLRLGAIIALAGVGLTLIFSVTNLVNFAHGELITLGALLAYFFSKSPLGPEWHLLIAVAPSVLLVALFSSLTEMGMWRPLRKKGTSDLSIMIISIGLSLVLRHIWQIIFGASSKPFRQYATQKAFNFLSFTTVPKTFWIIGISVLILVAMGLFLLTTKHGTSLRALADNPTLAKASGINTNNTILMAWIVGSATTALSGILLAATPQQVGYSMGWNLLLSVFAATILGGIGNVYGAMVGGILIGVFTEVSTYWVGGDLKFATALTIMCLVLLFRPQGVLGWKVRTA